MKGGLKMNELGIERFVSAHEMDFGTALKELSAGRKMSHWMWYIFPQIIGLGMSEISMYYAIQSVEEAQEYLKNDYLKEHMNLLLEVLLRQETSDPTEIFGFPDDMKLKSSMTLFSYVNPEDSQYKQVLDKFYDGEYDEKTLDIIKRMKNDM